MLTPITAVALRTVRHADRTAILTAWSRESGRLSLLVADGDGAGARRRRALTMPMALFSAMADVRPGREMHRITDLRPAAVTPTLWTHPLKSATAMFLAEVLTAVLRTPGQADPAIWRLIEDTVTGLDAASSARHIANTPLCFMVRLAGLAGIAPDAASWRPGRVLDLREGIMRDAAPVSGEWLTADHTRLAAAIMRQAARPGLLAIDNETRSAAVDAAVQYFTLHLPLSNLRTLPVLRALLR